MKVTGVMFPSDLQGTALENVWVIGYNATEEENQDTFMKDFWAWCDQYSSKRYKVEGHDVYDFDDELETYKRTRIDQENWLCDMGFSPRRQRDLEIEYIQSI